jgi:FG-GAP-like repeat
MPDNAGNTDLIRDKARRAAGHGRALGRPVPAAAALTIVVLCGLLVLDLAIGQPARSEPVGVAGDPAGPDRAPIPNLPRLASTAIDDPDRDGWDTEAFSNEAGVRLAGLVHHLESPADINPAALAGLITPDFSCGRLRPANLIEVFSDRSATVLRPSAGQGIRQSDGAAAAEATFKGAQGLAAALRELTAPFGQAKQIRAAEKVFRVEPKKDATFTLVRVEVYGAAGDGGVQQTAVWRCGWRAMPGGAGPRLSSIQLEDYEEAVVRAPQGRWFSDCTQAVMSHCDVFAKQLMMGSQDWAARMEGTIAHDVTRHQGIAIGDVNGDGLDDVFVCQAAGLPNRLFVQNQDGTVREVSAWAGVDWLEPTTGALLIDLDNDGDKDLVMVTDTDLMVLANDGTGRFTQKALLPLFRPAYSLTAADYDQDGDLDVYVCVYDDRKQEPGQLPQPVPFFDANNGGRNVLWRNDIKGDQWRFTDVTAETGLDQNNTRWSFAAAWEDYDNDGDLDLYVANDFGRNNLYRNEGPPNHPHFVDRAAQAGVEDGSFGMSVTWSDYNHDGWMDLYISNMFSSAGNRVTYQRQFKQNADAVMRGRYQYLARGNSLFENAGDGTFRDVSVDSATSMGRWAWASLFVDVNNDGWDDLLVANGYLTNALQDDL